LKNENIANLLQTILIDYFFVTTVIVFLITASLFIKQYYKIDQYRVLAMSLWILIVIAGVLIYALLLIEFFSHGKGVDRLAVVPYLLGAIPIALSAIALTFLYSRQTV
jgi:hypothetical protein